MIGKDKIFAALSSILKRSDADQTEAVFIGSDNALTRFANSFIHQNVSETNSKTYIRAILGKKIGVAVTNSFKRDDLKKALENAIEIAKNQKENPDFSTLPSKEKYVKLRTHFKNTASFTPAQRASEVKKIFDKAAAHKLTVAGSFSTGESEVAVMNTNGVRCYQPLSAAAINVVIMSDNSSGYAEDLNRDVSKIDVEKLSEIAIQKCLGSRNPKGVEPGEYDVILEHTAVANLLEWMNYIGFGSKSFQEKTSFLADRIGQKIMGDNISIYDDGNDESAVAFPFDFEGAAKKKVTLIQKGIAKGVVYDSISANKDKVKSTGHALLPDEAEGALCLNVFVKAGNSSRNKMIESCARGLLITRFHYINGLLDTRNALMTGMTRDGTFWIEDGKIQHGVKNLRFTESMLKAFSNVELISRDRKIVNSWWGDVGCIVCPAMFIKNFKFTGKTDF
jgi:predicted Zn-dependent protease